MMRSKSKSSEATAEISLRRSVWRVLLPLVESSRPETGRLRKDERRTSARSQRSAYLSEKHGNC